MSDIADALSEFVDGRLVVLAEAVDSLAARVAALEAAPTPPPPEDAPPPPLLVSPETVVARSGTWLQLDPGRDYIVTQDGPLKGNVRVLGGRNIIWRGMRVNIPVVPNGTGSAFANARKAPHFEGFTGHLYLADSRVTGDVGEGIIFNVPSGYVGGKVTIFDYRCELVSRAFTRMVNGVAAHRAPTWPTDMGSTRGRATYDGLQTWATGRYWDEHNDSFQSWYMPQEVHVERVTVVTPCQFNYLEPSSGRKLTLKDINVRPYTAPWDGTKVADNLFYADGWAVTVENVWGDWARLGLPGVKQGVPPGGDFVP